MVENYRNENVDSLLDENNISIKDRLCAFPVLRIDLADTRNIAQRDMTSQG